MDIIERALNNDKRALAKTITIVENNLEGAKEILELMRPHTGHAYIIGITGSPGSGKSTLVDRLIVELRKDNMSIGVIAIDPTSPFTNGAFLGDRIRMLKRSSDKDVFIRSLGTRGGLRGLSETTGDIIKILDATGKDIILVETAGAGQSEVDVVKVADTTIVVTSPGYGDYVQISKAGIMEIADVFAVNKADLDGADLTVMDIETMLDLSSEKKWRPPVIKTIAADGKGITDLLEAINKHRKYLEHTGLLHDRRLERCKSEVVEILRRNITSHAEEKLGSGEYEDILEKIVSGEISPRLVAEKILKSL